MGSGMRARVGVIGAGSWAIANHIPILAARDDVELVSAVRTNRKALALLQARFGFDHVSDDYREALDLGLDAVVIAGPAGLHYEHARAALEAGADVLCEKPFTTDPGHAWDLHDIASQRGLLHGTGSYRGQDAFFHPPGGPGPIPDCPGADTLQRPSATHSAWPYGSPASEPHRYSPSSTTKAPGSIFTTPSASGSSRGPPARSWERCRCRGECGRSGGCPVAPAPTAGTYLRYGRPSGRRS